MILLLSEITFFSFKLSLPITFLEVDPSEWKVKKDFKNAKRNAEKMDIIDNNAEGAVVLIKSFNTYLTNNEK